MTQFLLVSIFLMAGLSLLSYVYCWHDILRGRPHIVSLRQITTIMDRHLLNRLYGFPRPGYYYVLAPEHLRALVKHYRWFYYRECAADLTCVIGVWWYTTGFGIEDLRGWFILLAGVCQSINMTYALWLIKKWRHQIREELEKSID